MGVTHDPVSNPKKFRNKAVNGGWVTCTAIDPLTTALKATRATSVDPREFRALGGNAFLLRPLTGRGFQVWELPNRFARDGIPP